MSNNRTNLRVNPLDAIGVFFDVTSGLGDFIANGTPEPDSIPGVIQQRYRDHCDAWSRGERWITSLTPVQKVGMSSMCNPWLESQGSGDPGLEVSVQGGQCEGVEYRAGAPNVTTTSHSKGIGPLSVTTEKVDNWSDTGRPVFIIRFNWAGGLTGGSGIFQSFDDGPNPTISERYSNVVAVRADDLPDECGDRVEPGPNPNPRPDPGLPPDDRPFVDPEGRPVLPIPPIDDPLGDPIQLPNFPLPDLFGDDGANESANPNVGPPLEKGDEQAGNEGQEDDDFGEPPDGHIWVGFIAKMSNQGVSEGLQVNSPPEPIYRSTTGNYRAKYDVDGETVYSTPRRIEAETSVYWLDLPGLTLVGARVNVPSNDSYTVTPLSQPVESQDPQEI